MHQHHYSCWKEARRCETVTLAFSLKHFTAPRRLFLRGCKEFCFFFFPFDSLKLDQIKLEIRLEGFSVNSFLLNLSPQDFPELHEK